MKKTVIIILAIVVLAGVFAFSGLFNNSKNISKDNLVVCSQTNLSSCCGPKLEAVNCTSIEGSNETLMNCSCGAKASGGIFCDSSKIKKLKYDDVTKVTWIDPPSESTCTMSRYYLEDDKKIYYTEKGCSDDVIQAWVTTDKSSGQTSKYILSKESGCLSIPGGSIDPKSKKYFSSEFSGATKTVLGNVGHKLKNPSSTSGNTFDYISKEYCIPLEQTSTDPSVVYEMQKTNFETNFSDSIFNHC